MSIGVIGLGRFGGFMARHLSRRTKVLVYDRRRIKKAELPSNVVRASLAVVAAQPVVIFSVPVSALSDALVEARPFLRPGALVADTCAVKVQPVRWMKRLLPAHVDILGTHPFFGPESGRKGINGLTIILCPARMSGPHLSRVLSAVRSAGLRSFIMSPDEHDRLAAETIFLTQYLGRLVHRSSPRDWPPVTENYRHLRSIVETVRCDTPELFRDMVVYNAHAARLLRSIHSAEGAIQRGLGRKGR